MKCQNNAVETMLCVGSLESAATGSGPSERANKPSRSNEAVRYVIAL